MKNKFYIGFFMLHLLQKNKECAKFEHNGLENMTELEVMFAKIVVTNETKQIPTTIPILPEQHEVGVKNVVDLDEGIGDFDEVNIMVTQTERSNEKGKKNTRSCSIKGKGTKVK